MKKKRKVLPAPKAGTVSAEAIQRVVKAQQQVTGRLEGWSIILMYEDMYYLVGHVYDDIKGRFVDGALIHTSIITEGRHPHAQLKEGDVVHTTYSSYLLGARGAASEPG